LNDYLFSEKYIFRLNRFLINVFQPAAASFVARAEQIMKGVVHRRELYSSCF
jgi:hypothetical protein